MAMVRGLSLFYCRGDNLGLVRPDAPVAHQNEAEHRRLLANRANAALNKDGTNGMIAPLQLATYLFDDVPDPALWEGAIIYVPDEAGGAVLAFSDGTDWRRTTDRAVISDI